MKRAVVAAPWGSGVLGVGLRLRQTDHPLPGLPLAALLEHFHALEAFEDVSLDGDGAGSFKAAMLRHGVEIG